VVSFANESTARLHLLATSRTGSHAMRAQTPWPGRWQRRLLAVPGLPTDATTEVIWLQSGHLYADLRLPAGRPSFAGVASLAECTSAQLDWLTTQQGFAGSLEVYGDLYAWRRDIDFQPPPAVPDVGRMRQAADCIVETGVHAEYVEEWVHTPASAHELAAARLLVAGEPGEAAWWPGLVVTVGDECLIALGRRTQPADLPALFAAAFAARETDALRAALDCEISLARRDWNAECWRIASSTLPFREGLELAADETLMPVLHGHPTLARRELRGLDEY
jgi:hypothetical protein